MRSFVKLPVIVLALVLVGLLPLGASAAKGGKADTSDSGGNPNVETVWFSPGMGPVGTVVTVTGTGWRQHRGQTVSLAMCTPGAAAVATATIADDGTFAFAPVTIPSSGLYWMYDSPHCVFTIKNASVSVSHWWYVTS